MTSATPSRTASPPWGAILGAVAVVIIVIVAALWLLISSGAMSAFGAWMHESDIGSLLRHVLESLLLLVCLLLSTAALIYHRAQDLGCGAACGGARTWSGPWGILQPFADFFKFILKEPIIPASANKGVFVLAPLVSVVLAMSAWAVIPVARRMGRSAISTWASLSFRRFLAWRVRRHHGGVGVQFEICAALGATRSRSDGVLRGVDRLRDCDGGDVRRFGQP